jgi:antitoxin MazE
MRVARWGNSLAIRIPAGLAEKLDLKEGDEVRLRAAPDGAIEIGADAAFEAAKARLAALRFDLPPGYKFNRDDAYAED